MTDRLKEIEARHEQRKNTLGFYSSDEALLHAHADVDFLLPLLKSRAEGDGVGKLLEDMADAFEHIQSTYSLDLSDGTWLEELKDKARTRAADYIEAMGGVPADNGWQDISTAPKDGTPVIVRCDIDGDYIVVAQWFESSEFGGYAWTDFGVSDWGMQEFRQLNPTHWRPLPTPPTEKDMA